MLKSTSMCDMMTIGDNVGQDFTFMAMDLF